MPKDEFDFDDPMELNGMGLASAEDTTEAMTECFIEEFMRLGYNAKQVLALFRNPHYIGMNMVVQNRGEQFVRDRITEILARWGRRVSWPSSSRREEAQTSSCGIMPPEEQDLLTSAARFEHDATRTDPTGAPIPILNP